MSLLVIDIGGSSVKSAIFEETLSDYRTFQSPSSWEEMREKLDETIVYYLENYEVLALSFSVPAIPNQETGEIKGASSLRYIHGFSFREYFEKNYGLPVYFENDAVCACKAETSLGAARGAENALFLVIGTGIGGVILSNGEVQPGAHHFSGEFGMMLIDKGKEWSELGSAVHMARKFSKLKGKEYQGREVFALAEAGDKDAIQATEELYYYLALGIYNLQYMIDPERFILGGGITNNVKLISNIERKLSEIMSYGQRCPITPKIVKAVFGNDANLIGAGILAIETQNK
ncbi:MAG: ROK family protein [Lactobacillales bacterium]|jgi:predicted NBD/HSP70 family sugar kinase|nr:ROK family protein [Lactobacillales bacterium]